VSLLDLLLASGSAPASARREPVEPEQPKATRRWARPKRRTQADRIAAAGKLDDELRQTRAAREARWNAEELARQAIPNPPGVEAVKTGQEGRVA